MASLFDPINLDDLATDHETMTSVAVVLETLAAYARHKALAMGCRERGNVRQACEIEAGSLRRIYGELPEWARW